MGKSLGSVRNIWIEGGVSYCTSLPLEIIKKLNISQNDKLYVELVDELIVMRKHDMHLTKNQINKAQKISQQESSDIIQSENNDGDDDNINPLDGLDI